MNVLRHVLAAAVAALVPLSAGAAPKVAPVQSMCPSDRPHRQMDADGAADRCVDTVPAKRPDPAKPPTCPDGYALKAGTETCEKSGPPTCPSGFKLKPTKGQDRCYY
jgi:hypothetical protein